MLYDGKTVANFTEQHGVSIREKGPTGSLGRIFSIAEDAGNIWFGARDNGAWRFDGKSLTNFTVEDGLTSHTVWTIYRDKKDALWFGMSAKCVSPEHKGGLVYEISLTDQLVKIRYRVDGARIAPDIDMEDDQLLVQIWKKTE